MEDNGSYVNTSETVSYTVIGRCPNSEIVGLLPNTRYSIRVTSHNGVSDQDTENEALRQLIIQVKTAEGGEFVSCIDMTLVYKYDCYVST